LKIEPCIPRFWREFEIQYRHGKTVYRIRVENPHMINRGVLSIELDGSAQPNDEIALVDDGLSHEVRVVLGEKPALAEPSPTATPETAQQEQTL